MAVKRYRPTSAGQRFITTIDMRDLSKVKPERSLVEVSKKHSGRNNNGHITVRHKGGGTRAQYRIVDFKRQKDAIPAKVATIEYDPNRSARIALLHYRDGEKRYILAPAGLVIGQLVESGEAADIKLGNCLPLKNIPLGSERVRLQFHAEFFNVINKTNLSNPIATISSAGFGTITSSTDPRIGQLALKLNF